MPSHSREELLVFTAFCTFTVTTNVVENFAAKHCGAVGKRNVTGTTQQSPTIAWTYLTSGSIDAVAECADDSNIGSVLNDFPLTSESIWIRDVVSVHPRYDRRTGFCDDSIRAP